MSCLRAGVVIPALDEAATVGRVVRAALRWPLADLVVVDNGSRDGTAVPAARAGARVVREPRRGYGAACRAGVQALSPEVDVVVFLDADGSDDPARIGSLVAPIAAGEADLVVGSRMLGEAEPGALTPVQRAGNVLAAFWLRARFGLPATDLGPFRAVRRDALASLDLRDEDYGWTVEMQIRAARAGLSYREVSVPYRPRRAGRSKVSGSPEPTRW